MLPIACQTAGPNGFTFLGGRAVLKAKQNSNFFSQKKKNCNGQLRALQLVVNRIKVERVLL